MFLLHCNIYNEAMILIICLCDNANILHTFFRYKTLCHNCNTGGHYNIIFDDSISTLSVITNAITIIKQTKFVLQDRILLLFRYILPCQFLLGFSLGTSQPILANNSLAKFFTGSCSAWCLSHEKLYPLLLSLLQFM